MSRLRVDRAVQLWRGALMGSYLWDCSECAARGASTSSAEEHRSACPRSGTIEWATGAGPDPVKPRHYTERSIQPIEVIESWGLGFNLGTCLKYIGRHGKTPGESAIDDLRKARWYLDREIARFGGDR